MSTLFQDLRFATRLLIKDRSFTVTAILTLAVCVAANTAMFSIVRSVLLKPLPFAGSDRVVLLYNSYPNAGAPRVGNAVPDYYDRQSAVPALESLAVFRNEGMTLGDASGAERLNSLRATPSFFRLAGAQPARGRLFGDEESEPGKDRKVVLSYGFWQRKFAGADSAIGQTVRLNGTTYDVIGVMPREFTFLQNDIDLYLPVAFGPDDKSDQRRHSNNWQMVGRLKAGQTIAQVSQQVDRLNAQNDDRFPQFRQILKDARFHTVVGMLQDDVVRDVKASLYLLWGGVLFVLVIGCVNIANLIIVRSSARAREMATRHAIGGDLGRLARQLMTETMLLSLVGGVGGILMGWWALRSLSALNLDRLPRGYEIGLDPIGVAVILAIVLGVGVLLGLAPVWRLRRMNLNLELREETRGGTAGRRATLVRATLATMQIALALVLLSGAGLLLVSFREVMRLDLGFDPSHVMTASITLPSPAYGPDPDLIAFEQRVLQAVRALPEVEAAGLTSVLPFSGNINSNVILAEGHVMKPGESLLAPTSITVSTGYFEAMSAKLATGRFFDQRDTATAPRVVMIDERLAATFWPGRDAVGGRLYRPDDPKDLTKITPKTQFFDVVGVTKEMRLLDPRGDYKPVGVVFFPYEQNVARGLIFAIRARSDPTTVLNGLRRSMAGIDPQLPVFRPRTMQEWIDLALIGRRLPAFIAAAFAAVAVLLSAVGIYGVLAFTVVQRQRDFGVRMALGGTTGNIFALVLGGGLRIVGIGLLTGSIVAYFVGRLMQSQLFNVSPLDPIVIAGGILTLSIIALLASVIPAWRASRISPNVALSR